MLEELIKKEDAVKVFQERKEAQDLIEHDIPSLLQGKVLQVISDTEIVVETGEKRLDGELQIEFQKNVCYVIYFFSYEKVFLCTAYYRSSYTEEEKKILSFELLSPLERVQRRMHHRVSIHAKLFLHKLEDERARTLLQQVREDEKSESVAELAYYEEAMIDMSAGGIRFTAKKPVQMGEYVFMKFEVLDREEPCTVTSFGQIIYAEPLRNEQDVSDVRLKFLGMSERFKEKIIRYIFQLEREKRRAGGRVS